MGILGANKKGIQRVETSVRFTEEYTDRFKALLNNLPRSSPGKVVTAVRGILLQNVYGGNDGLMLPIYRQAPRDENGLLYRPKNFMIQIVGENNSVIPDNTFKLKLSGATRDPDTGNTSFTEIGTTTALSMNSTASDVLDALVLLLQINPAFGYVNISVAVGNPYFDFDLVSYGDDNIDSEDGLGKSYPGLWYVSFDPRLLPQYDYLVLDAGAVTVTSLTSVIVTPTYELVATETTVVTDVYNRTKDYPWQIGTIVSCLDYADVGYGIVASSYRNFSPYNLPTLP